MQGKQFPPAFFPATKAKLFLQEEVQFAAGEVRQQKAHTVPLDPGSLARRESVYGPLCESTGSEISKNNLSKGEGYRLKAGDCLAVDTPGGGGYGDPKDRAPELIERDQRAGYFQARDR